MRSASLLALVLSGGLAALLGWAVVSLPVEPGGLGALVAENISQAGAAHPVTAVLLDFRAYDTWLEVGVLLLAVLAVLALHRLVDAADLPVDSRPDPLLTAMTRLIAPIMVLVAGFLLWLGTDAPGGAFQAGAVLAAALVLGWLAGVRWVGRTPAPRLQILLALAFAGFLALALATVLAGRPMLDHPPALAGTLIALVELGVTASVGISLALLFVVARGR